MWTVCGILGTALAACSSSSSTGETLDGGPDGSVGADGGGDSSSPDPFVGSWTCKGTTTTTFTQPAGMQPRMASYTSAVTIVDDGDGTVTVTSNDGHDPICTLKFDRFDNVLTIEAGQTCNSATGGLVSTYTSGGAMVTSPTSFTSSNVSTLSGTVTLDGGSPSQVAAVAMSSGTCTKQGYAARGLEVST
jgi:hypothetical protein